MNIAIRTDANFNIGMGHIMRCLSIADAFSSGGHHVSFVLADDTVESLVKGRGYEAVILHSDYTKMEEELSSWPVVMPYILIVDSYYVTVSYLSQLHEEMRSVGGSLVYIDDVYTFPYSADILVDYNVYATHAIYEELYRGTEKPQFILGPTYAPLRPMFGGLDKKVQPEKVENILISTGGSDELNLELSILKSLLQKQNNGRIYHFLLGAMNTDKEEIKRLAGENIVLHENVTDMKNLISSMDLVISAAGSTLYEICACGVPFITYSIADNQVPGAEAFERLGLGINIGDLRDPDTINSEFVMSGTLNPSAVERLLKATDKLTDDYRKRVLMGIKMQSMIDGFGANRIVWRILELAAVD